jgi:hypothetical protein
MISLWPEITEVSEVTPPVAILDQQALMLGNMTKNVLLADVKMEEGNDYEFAYSLYIVAPVLDNYKYKLLTIFHSIDLYPVVVQVEASIWKEIDKSKYSSGKLRYAYQADSEDQFLEILRAIFSASKTKRVIAALLAQSLPPGHKSSQE